MGAADARAPPPGGRGSPGRGGPCTGLESAPLLYGARYISRAARLFLRLFPGSGGPAGVTAPRCRGQHGDPDAALEHAPLLYDARYISRVARDFFRARTAMPVNPRPGTPARQQL